MFYYQTDRGLRRKTVEAIAIERCVEYMKFHMDPPPITEEAQNNTAQLISWLYSLTDTLNVVLANLGYENFNRDVRAQLEERSKQ